MATDKFAAYERFKEYYKRDTCSYNPSKGLVDINDGFEPFIKKHPRFIIKPLCANSGSGVRIIEIDSSKNIQQVITSLKEEYSTGFIAEELIVQVNELAQFHPKSVNTVRINTFNIDGKFYVKFPSIRLGRGNAIVDNANAGGITGGIDAETGSIIAVGDENGKRYYEHPDTKIKFSGFVIPKWNELCQLAKTIAQDFPECKIIGFDFALTENGWVLVEINAYPLLIFQIATQIGLNEEMQELENKLLKK